MLDDDLLLALNTYAGYLEASGYERKAIISHFSNILLVTNRSLAFNTKIVDNSFKVALVTKLHPALPNLNKIIDKFYPVISGCPLSSKIFPRESLIFASRKLAPLSSILTSNPFFIPSPSVSPKGFHQSPGCNCKVCKESTFTSIMHSSTSSGRGFSIPNPINCTAVNVVYSIICPCGLLYVGKTTEPKPRWANHKSHIRNGKHTCKLSTASGLKLQPCGARKY